MTGVTWPQVVDAFAAVATAFAGVAAWRAASASRDALREQRASARLSALTDVHETLTVLGVTLRDSDAEQFESYRAILGRRLPLVDASLPATRELWKHPITARTIEEQGRGFSEPEELPALRTIHESALAEVEAAIERIRVGPSHRRWWWPFGADRKLGGRGRGAGGTDGRD